MMRILGLDPGTALLGWGVIEYGIDGRSDKAACVGYGCIVTDKSMTDSQRLLAIANGLEAILDEHKPDLVSVERLFFSNNQKTVMTVSQARGVILYMIERMGYSMVEYTPQEVKQALTGYGKAEKQQIQQMTKLLLRLEQIPKPDDAADALAIAITAGQHQVFAQKTRAV
jgi:crossover junction endodeoxyribonuclease RuvC